MSKYIATTSQTFTEAQAMKIVKQIRAQHPQGWQVKFRENRRGRVTVKNEVNGETVRFRLNYYSFPASTSAETKIARSAERRIAFEEAVEGLLIPNATARTLARSAVSEAITNHNTACAQYYRVKDTEDYYTISNRAKVCDRTQHMLKHAEQLWNTANNSSK